MHISILGGGGFLGRRLAARLAADGALGGVPVRSLTLFDLQPPPAPDPAAFPVTTLGGDLAALPEQAIPASTDLVFHLAAVVSAAAEADYELGRRVNLRGTDAVIDSCRRLDAPPRLVFTSSIASFSARPGQVLGDDARQLPANSYGAQKAAAELVLTDASRRGFVDAVCLRLPTIMVRPGRPNRAASSFVSAIVREPLLGLPTDLPVAEDFAAWVASPRRAVDWLRHAAVLPTAAMGLDRAVNPPGLTVTVGEILAALDAVQPGASAQVVRLPDPAIQAIVELWPAAFDTARARTLGFSQQETLVELVRSFVADDLAATRAERGL